MKDAYEKCAGCGAVSETHPFIGIGTRFDGLLDCIGKKGNFPICDLCHKNPTHRLYRLKMHFFPKSQAKIAIERAWSTELG